MTPVLISFQVDETILYALYRLSFWKHIVTNIVVWEIRG